MTTTQPPGLARTPLHDRHVAARATMVPYAGWSMPVKFTSDVAEHNAVRSAAGLFDISHMAQISVSGPDAAAFLDHALAGRMSSLQPLQSRYTMLLAPNAGIVDDLIVTNTHLPGEGTLGQDGATPTEFLIVANAGNRAAVVTALTDRLLLCTDLADRYDVEVTETHRALIAVQGPRAEDILAELIRAGRLTLNPAAGVDLATLRYYRSAPATLTPAPTEPNPEPNPEANPAASTEPSTDAHRVANPAPTTQPTDVEAGVDVLVSRTGYTGEDGFEISLPASAAGDLWDALIAAGHPFGLLPAGLAARDTLRLEAGMPLYGHELTLATYPFQAGLGRIVATSKADFIGRDAYLLAQQEDADAPVLVGLSLTGRRAARAGYPVLDAAGGPVGQVTSGVLSPTLGHPIAMAYVPPSSAREGTVLQVDVRGTALPATVVPMPFYRRAKEA